MRYFIILYEGKLGKDTFKGNISLEHKTYPNRDLIIKEIEELYGYNSVFINDIKELVLEDYENWNAKIV
ncbi:hypothetical protein [Flagellimonas sp. CMM7]|uniref:hypothetical protein n=1 Tax=Flagellimonas sp. CMM7 TaxID=2654676 RepID=UPI0013D24351|nr:hypothetical protein [Flagellimonas sp. CMM7]UII80068.1 hypothetical protein LV704_00755 [Flagellimonas sp. CMM7]